MNNNYPYNPYAYNPQQYQQQYQQMQQNGREKRDIRRRSNILACGIIIYVVISNVLVFLSVSTAETRKLFDENCLYSNAIQIIVSIIALMGAYFIVKLMLDRKHEAFIPFGAPANKKHALLLIPFGVCACITGSWATYYMNVFLEDVFSVTFTQPEIPDPKTGLEAVIYIVAFAIVPAFVEEIALRAGALQAMRKYGDWFAIVTSSFIFAVLHGNMVQTPFAFIAGLALGYIFVATGSIWPGIIIHFINNLVSSVLTIAPAFGISNKTIDVVYSIYIFVFVTVGAICFVFYLFDKKRPVLKKDTSTLSVSQKTGAFIINVPMIISLIYVCLITAQYIESKV